MSFWEREVRFGQKPQAPEPESEKEEPKRPDLRRLLGRGHDGVTELLERMKIGAFPERIAAIEALSESDDERVAPALIAAFQSTFPGRSSRVFLLVGWGLATACALANLIFYLRPQWAPGWLQVLAASLVLIFLVQRWPGRKLQTPVLRAALADALIKVAERRPSRELCVVADDLRLVSKEIHTLTPDQRKQASTARARLMELAGDFRVLPVAAEKPEPEVEGTLPRVSDSPETQRGSLPVAVQSDGRRDYP